MRGRIIFAFLAELHRLDTMATATTPPGYDDDFKEPALLDTGDGLGATQQITELLVQLAWLAGLGGPGVAQWLA